VKFFREREILEQCLFTIEIGVACAVVDRPQSGIGTESGCLETHIRLWLQLTVEHAWHTHTDRFDLPCEHCVQRRCGRPVTMEIQANTRQIVEQTLLAMQQIECAGSPCGRLRIRTPASGSRAAAKRTG
jgi:hypothetical protein